MLPRLGKVPERRPCWPAGGGPVLTPGRLCYLRAGCRCGGWPTSVWAGSWHFFRSMEAASLRGSKSHCQQGCVWLSGLPAVLPTFSECLLGARPSAGLWGDKRESDSLLGRCQVDSYKWLLRAQGPAAGSPEPPNKLPLLHLLRRKPWEHGGNPRPTLMGSGKAPWKRCCLS